MDPKFSAQDILLCDLCREGALQSYCELCLVNICINCVGKHLSDSSKRHNVVPYRQKPSAPNYPKCPNHTQKHCELYCERCVLYVCSICLSSGNHKGHDLSDALQKLKFKLKDLQKDLKELEKRIYPTYEEIASGLNHEKEKIEKHYEELKTAVTKQGDELHREINVIEHNLKSEINEMKIKHLAILNEQENQFQMINSDVKQSITDLKKLLDSDNISISSEYKSRNAEFRSLPPKIKVSTSSFSPHQINTEQLHQMFGSLSALSITTEKQGYTMEIPENVSCSQVKLLIDEPEIVNTVDVEYDYLYNVTCLNDEEIWTCGKDKNMNLYNLHNKLLKSIQTKSGNHPRDMAVTKSGDLVYTDPDSKTVNKVKNKKIKEVIRLEGWIPYYLCSTSCGDLLVTMNSADGEQSKIVRYSGSTEKQSIQFDSKGKPLFTSGYYKYVCENRNLDICVADWGACSIVVVNRTGKFRFKYTGHPSSTLKESFYPYSIATDSQSQILTADCADHCIHILDQDGEFLRYIDNCDLQYPWDLCVDTRDNLFVAECYRHRLIKIKYMKDTP
ncbi:E3 ubiquitin-protein ligase TRIM36-like [Saccostrea cucullata]|uniref:E3 ubiquitin-protein ligase TRIM36-like n=1 Tax=Saccostrea cuccullata TaxID=36930 RepID=UPI002ED6312A